jgi:acyl-CoA-binding protein
MLLVASFAIIIFMPFFMLGWDYVKVFWIRNWYLAAVFFLTLVILNIYFLCKWKLFSLVEAENWNELRQYLEQRIYEKKSSSRQAVRILINTYIVLADTGGLMKLSRYLAENKPRLFAVFALDLGIPYIVRAAASETRAYFEEALKNPRARKRDWLRWNLAFARMACGGYTNREQARAELARLAEKPEDPLVWLLSVYLLDKSAEKSDAGTEFMAAARASLKGRYTREKWGKIPGRAKNSLIILVLSKLIAEAENWLFEEKTEEKTNGGV